MRNYELIKEIYEVCLTSPYHEDMIADMKHENGCTSMRDEVSMETWILYDLQTEYIISLIEKNRPEIAGKLPTHESKMEEMRKYPHRDNHMD
jgi:hypothetical protein